MFVEVIKGYKNSKKVFAQTFPNLGKTNSHEKRNVDLSGMFYFVLGGPRSSPQQWLDFFKLIKVPKGEQKLLKVIISNISNFLGTCSPEKSELGLIWHGLIHYCWPQIKPTIKFMI